MPAPHHSFFTGWMPFLPPNQQCQSTEGMKLIKERNWKQKLDVLRNNKLKRPYVHPAYWYYFRDYEWSLTHPTQRSWHMQYSCIAQLVSDSQSSCWLAVSFDKILYMYVSICDCLQSFAGIDSSVLFELRHKGVPTMIFRAENQQSCERYAILATIHKIMFNIACLISAYFSDRLRFKDFVIVITLLKWMLCLYTHRLVSIFLDKFALATSFSYSDRISHIYDACFLWMTSCLRMLALWHVTYC